MTNRIVDRFFANYRLLPDWDAFSAAQAKLLSRTVVIVAEDHRGNRVGGGLAAYLDEVREHAETFEPGSDRALEEFDTSPGQITVRIRGTVRLREPLAGVRDFADDRHLWTETFRFDADGKISQIESRLILKRPD